MSRDEAIKILSNISTVGRMNGKHLIIKALHMAIESLEERKRGEWIQIEDVDANGNALYECPFCRKSDCHAVSQIVSYCWNCGAEMRGDTDESR